MIDQIVSFSLLNNQTYTHYALSYKTITVKEEIYNLIKDRAKKGCRGISNQVEFELMREHY